MVPLPGDSQCALVSDRPARKGAGYLNAMLSHVQENILPFCYGHNLICAHIADICVQGDCDLAAVFRGIFNGCFQLFCRGNAAFLPQTPRASGSAPWQALTRRIGTSSSFLLPLLFIIVSFGNSINILDKPSMRSLYSIYQV